MISPNKDLVEAFTSLSRWEGVNIKQGLEPLRALLERLGSPQNSYPSIIIGGTNGKGSTAAMLAAILQEAGFVVGLYTSPHLFRFNERIRVASREISNFEISHLLDTLAPHRLRENISWFEFVTAMAFVHFARQNIDIAVLEVGLGGRLDATNIASSQLCAITNIALDHQDYLGSSLAAIAAEKAGIIKEKSTCVTCERDAEALAVISARAQLLGSPLLRIDEDFYFEKGEGGLTYQSRHFTTIAGIKFPLLLGRHQCDNALSAITLALALAKKGFVVDAEAIKRGLQGCRWHCRCEIISKEPLVVFDGAHNVAGMSALAATIREHFADRRVTAVLGFLRDKDYGGMLRAIAPVVSRVIFTTPLSPRALEPLELSRGCRYLFPELPVEVVSSPPAALERACSFSKDDKGMVCIAGSLFLAAPLESAFAPTWRSNTATSVCSNGKGEFL